MQPYWHRQPLDKPLYPDLLWSRPENKRLAGKLLIIGGNVHGFAAAAEAYMEATKAGIGVSRVLLPDSLQKTVGRVFEAGEYAPSTPSGSFNQQALAEVLSMSQWSDGVLLAGDFGRNSETAILLERVIEKYNGQLTLTQDGLDYFTKSPNFLLNREKTLLVASFAQLQKIGIGAGFPRAFTFNMDFIRLVEMLHEFSEKYPISVITKHLDNVFVAINGKVSTTKIDDETRVWRVKTSAHAATWWLQNPDKTYEALTSSITTNFSK
jgi:thiamine pyrophosphate-dependent acetolactate synthase large subunit-like protein